MGLTELDPPHHPGCVQTSLATAWEQGCLFPHQRQPQVPVTTCPHVSPPRPSPLEGARGEAGGGVSHAHPWSRLLDRPALHLRCGLCLLDGVPLSKPLVGSRMWGLILAQLHWGATHNLGRTCPNTGWRTRCTFSLKRMSEPASSAPFWQG